MPSSKEDGRAKLLVCSKYLELFTRMKELGQRFEVLSVDLLVSMRDMLQSDPVVDIIVLLLYLAFTVQMRKRVCSVVFQVYFSSSLVGFVSALPGFVS